MISKVVAVGVMVALVAAAWMFRYDMVPVQVEGRGGQAYLLDRWTGEVYWLTRSDKIRVTPE
jgi:hypothetical protein